ncbi:MAG: LysR family transcriptional regulator [Lachnospiraceae bacterium]|nr:LysR family transcriptional regulator [Lachnospiraceae bacterium]
MTFDQLEYFTAVAEEKNIYDAAERVHITQSALSKQLQKLEKELGVSLLDRSHRKAVLTDAGELFYKEAQSLLSQYHCSLDRLYALRRCDENVLRIGTLPFQAQYGIAEIFRNFIQKNPDIQLIQEEVEDEKLTSGLHNGKYDLIIARSSMLDKNSTQRGVICIDRLVAVLPSDHSLSRRKSLSLSDISGEGFVLMNPYTSVYSVCIDEFNKAGIRPNIIGTARPESILSSVSLGNCISLLPLSSFEIFRHNGVKTIPLSPDVQLPIVVIGKKGAKSRAVTAFVKTL